MRGRSLSDIISKGDSELYEILEELRKKLGHEGVRAIQESCRELRKIGIYYFPAFVLYRLSLLMELNEDYRGTRVKEIAEAEGLSEKTIYNLLKDYMNKKSLTSKICHIKRNNEQIKCENKLTETSQAS